MTGSSTCWASGSKPPKARRSGPGVCANLANRGVRDVLIVCCDGLTGLPEAITATWPHATIQTCVVHLIRSSMRFVAYQDRKKVVAREYPINGVSGGFYWWVLAAGIRSAKVKDLTTRYSVFNAACSFGKCPRALTALRNLAFSDSIAFVEHRTLRISTS